MAQMEKLNDERIVVATEYHEKDLVKIIPGYRWDEDNKWWTLPLTWASCIIARNVFGDKLSIGRALNEWAHQEIRDRIQPVSMLRELLDDSSDAYVKFAPAPLPSNDHDAKLYPFQKVGRAFLATAGDALLADEMGTGKTIQTLAAIRVTPDSLPALIVCPNTLKTSWADHTKTWLPEATPYVLTGSTANRKKQLATAQSDPTALVITNIESLRTLSSIARYGSIHVKRCKECDPRTGDPALTEDKCQKHPKALNRFGFKLVVTDEAHRVKDPKALQTRAMWAVMHGPTVLRRWALTGTPIANHPGDLWPLMHAIAPAEYPNKYGFINRYAVQEFNSAGYMVIKGLRQDNKAEFFRFFDPRFRRVTKGLVLKDLPEKSRVLHTVEMTPKQKTAYNQMASSLMTQLEDGTYLVAASNLTAQVRLLQLASSYCEIDKGETPEDVASWKVELKSPSPKVDAMVSILGDLGIDPYWDGTGNSVVIAAEQRKLLELAAVRLDKEKIPYVMVTGAVPEAVRPFNVAEFQDGKVPVLLMTYKAGGVGLTMTRANTMIRLQRSWSLVDNRQGEDRVHRIGSEIHDSVTIIDVVTEGTVEVAQQHRLAVKMQRLEELMRDRERLIKAGEPTDALDNEEAALNGSFLGRD